MNKKRYLFTILLLSGGCIATTYVNAKPTAPHSSNLSGAVKSEKAVDNNSLSDIQDEPISLPKIDKIQFSGNTVISSDELRKAIPLKVQDIANENVIMDSMVKIAELYKIKNIKVTITPILEKTSINSRGVLFDIHETAIDKK